MADKIEPLVFEPYKTTPGLEIRQRSSYSFKAGGKAEDFNITLWTDGAEFSRKLTLDEMGAMRDWLNETVKSFENDEQKKTPG